MGVQKKEKKFGINLNIVIFIILPFSCQSPCSSKCPPCLENCEFKCAHSRCKRRCGISCEPCKELCTAKCRHMKCVQNCGNICSSDKKVITWKPCTMPCPKKLRCGHSCIGFCGDPCPLQCKICNSSELTEFFLLGNESDENAR